MLRKIVKTKKKTLNQGLKPVTGHHSLGLLIITAVEVELLSDTKFKSKEVTSALTLSMGIRELLVGICSAVVVLLNTQSPSIPLMYLHIQQKQLSQLF